MTPSRVAALVVAVGGGAASAWLFTTWAAMLSHGPGVSRGPQIWLGVVCFSCTALLSARAVTIALRKSNAEQTWLASHVLYGGLNGVASLGVFLAGLAIEHGVGGAPLWLLLLLAVVVAVIGAAFGGGFGALFFLLYLPTLRVADRAGSQPSHDVISRMIPWCAGSLVGIAGVVVGFGEPLIVPAALCLGLAAALLVRGARADLAHLALLGRLDAADPRGGLRVSQLELRADVLPLVGGLDVERALVSERSVSDGPFRGVSSREVAAAMSADPGRERRALRLRQGTIALVAAAWVTVVALAALG